MSKNTKMKKSITMILTLLLLIASVPTYGAKPAFSDIEGHWAKKYIEEMAARKYLNGYPGGSFKPQGDLTLMQAISTLSRLAEVSESEKTKAMSGYAFLFDELKIELDWEQEGLAVLLLKNILTEKEVRDAKNKNILSKTINRERTSELLAKTMGLESAASSIIAVQVNYGDILKVDPSKRKYLEVLLDAGVLDPKGTGNNDFEPKSSLTRAAMSKLLFEASAYMDKKPVKDEPVEYEYITDTFVRVTDDAGTMLVVRGKTDNPDGEGYRVEDETTITIDGKKSDLRSLSQGQEVRLKLVKSSINLVSVEAYSKEETVSGIASYVSNSTNKITLEYKDDKKILTKEYDVDNNAKIYLDGKLAGLKDLKNGDLLELKVKGGRVTEIEANSKVKKLTGIIKEIVPIREGKETVYLITIHDKDENDHKYLTDDKTTFYRKDKPVDGQDIKLKDEAYIDAEYDLDEDIFIAKTIDANVFKSKVRGRVTEIVKRLNKNTLVTIENYETKKEESYELSSNVEIVIDGDRKTDLPADPGYYAELELENDEIMEIYIDSKRAEESITGRIIDINRRDKTIYLEENSMHYDKIDGEDYIIISTNNKTIFQFMNITNSEFSDLKIGDNIIVGGVYKGKNFEANLIFRR